MKFFSKTLLNVAVMSEDGGSATKAVSANVLKENSDFREFAARMESGGKVYFVQAKNGSTRRLACDASERDDSATSTLDPEAEKKEWLDCCLRDYLLRKQQFEKKCGSRSAVVLRILAICVPCFAALWALWPLWDFLVDVDAEVYYKILGVPASATPAEVKRGYREQMRRWHPDKNLSCGEPCIAQVRKIQLAYDVLMARGDQRAELANRYRAELLQVRSLVFFRIYEMASNAAQELFNIVVTTWNGTLSDTTATRVRVASSISTILFFTAYETLFVGGFNLVMILQVFYLVVSIVSSAKRENYISKARKAAYVDLMREAGLMLLPLGVLGVVCTFWATSPGNRIEEAFRWAFGCFYVSAYLYRFTPNLHDNLRKRSCTISINYFLKLTEPVVSFVSVATAELGFLVDDLFVFTCRVPSVFRAAVFASHIIYLCQLAFLPWEGPLRLLNSSVKRAPEGEGRAASMGTPALGVESGSGVAAACALQPRLTIKVLPRETLSLLTNLDADQGGWRRVATAPYHKIMLEAMLRFAQARNVVPRGVDVVPCTNFEDVCVVVEVPDTAPSANPNAQSQARHQVVQLVKDRACCRMLAFCTGPLSMVPPPGVSVDANAIRAKYAETFGADANRTPSMVWRGRLSVPGFEESPTKTTVSGHMVCFMCTFALLMSTLLLMSFTGSLVPPMEAYRATLMSLPKSMQPFAHLRLSRVFGAEHPVSARSAGLVTTWKGALTICTIDVWDAYRQFRLYSAK